MIWRTITDVAICTGILVGLVAFALLGHWAMAGREP